MTGRRSVRTRRARSRQPRATSPEEPPISTGGRGPAEVTDAARLSPDWPSRVRSMGYASLSLEAPLEAGVHRGNPGPGFIDLHQAAEVGIVLEGEVQRVFLDEARRLRAGDVWLAPGWDPHGVGSLTESETVALMFLPEFLGSEFIHDVPWMGMFAVRPSERPRVLDAETRARALAIGRALKEEIVAEQAGWAMAVRLGLLQLLLLLRRGWERPPRHEAWAAARASALEQVMPAVTLLHTRPGWVLSLEEAAQACKLSVGHFGRVFRSTMGISFGRFCLRTRLSAAARLLLTTDLPTEAIADQSGFTDASHLYHAFVRHYHTTPSAYREERQMRRAVP
jgi:AraC family transcriptional activator of mtrCDE